MRKFIVLLLLGLSLAAQASELPNQIVLKGATQSFTHEYDVAIQEGKLWYRAKAKSAANLPQWKLLGATGLPRNTSLGLSGFASPSSVTQLSADGNNLIAIGDDGLVYYMKWSSRKWTNKWGQPLSKKLHLPDNIRGWSISHRGPLAGGYKDIDGNFHPIMSGVTTLYVLNADGLKISYADPWLPADFSHEIGGPLRNRFRARAISASASTLFVINDAGEMYTRLADFDTLGHNPFLSYSYERRRRDIPNEKDVRTLPPEEWKKQPSISPAQGRISSAITILQTGRGNDARELRVEGVNPQGASGYFSKPLNGETWHFTQTDLPLQKPLLSSGDTIADLGPNLDQTLRGHLRLRGLRQERKFEVELRDFNPLCSGATLVVKLGDDNVPFPFLTTATSQIDRKMNGAILLPREIKAQAAKNKELGELIQNVFGENSFIQIKLKVDEQGAVQVKSSSSLSLFPAANLDFPRTGK